MLALALACALEPSRFVPAGEPVSAGAERRILQIQARELWTVGGERIADGLLVVAEGRVRSVGPAKNIDPGLPLLRHDGVVTAGMVACRSEAGTAGELQDDTRSVLATARAAYAFDASSADFERALAAGITALEIAPASGNLVGGLACVVKTAGGRVLAPEASLTLALTAAALGRSTGPAYFSFGAAETDEILVRPDGGPETTAQTTRGNREPTSYAGALAMLAHLMAAKEGPFARVARGELRVTIEAWDRHEVLRAAAFARQHELEGAIRGAPLAGDPDVRAALAASGLGVIVGPYTAGQTRPSLDSVRLLAADGIPVAFALDDPTHAPAELRLTAARALAAGAEPATVWKGLTEHAALLAGVGAAVGALAPGREADFVLWSGDPLDLTSRVVAVYVDGARAWPRRSGD